MTDPMEAAVILARAQDDVLTRRQALAAGLSAARLRGLVESGTWASPIRGSLVVRPVRDQVRTVARAALLARPTGVICSFTAARLHGMQGGPAHRPGTPAHLMLPRATGRRQCAGIRTHWSDLDAYEVVDVGGLAATSPARTIVDVVVASSRERAVSMIDSALHRGLVEPGDLAVLAARIGRRGGRLRAGWVASADGSAESPLESRLRLLLRAAGLDGVPQFVVRAPENTIPIARVDFAWPGRRLAVEADGRGPHGTPAAVYADRFRQNALVARGWRILRFTWDDVIGRPGWIVAAIRGELARAA